MMEMETLKSVGTIIASLAIAVAAAKFVFFGGTVSYDSPIGKIEFSNKSGSEAQIAGLQGKPREGSNNTVWQSDCPPMSKPISGTCVINPDPGQKDVPALQNIGPNTYNGVNRWECAWRGPVQSADVRAVCVRTN